MFQEASHILVTSYKYCWSTVVAMGLELKRWGMAICLQQWETLWDGIAFYLSFFFCTIKFIMKMNAISKQDWRNRLVVGLGKVYREQSRLNQVALWFI